MGWAPQEESAIKYTLAVEVTALLVVAVAAGCCGPCVAVTRLGAQELGERVVATPTAAAPGPATPWAAAPRTATPWVAAPRTATPRVVAPTDEGRPVWFELWAEGTTLRRSEGEASIDYRMLGWCIYQGDVSRLQRAADQEMAFDMAWMGSGTYTVWLEAWWDGKYHQVSDKITVEVGP